MNRACGILREYEDFQCFSKVETDVKTFLCRVEEAHWETPEPHRLVFTITADRFLRNMVRAIVGTMLEIGRGKRSPESLRGIIESHDRRQAGCRLLHKGSSSGRWNTPGKRSYRNPRNLAPQTKEERRMFRLSSFRLGPSPARLAPTGAGKHTSRLFLFQRRIDVTHLIHPRK